MRLILVRHGITEWNASLRYQGWTDVPLSAKGREQALLTAERLREEEITGVYSSDLLRAYESATLIAAPHSLSVVSRKDLREMNFGRWEGLTFEEISKQDQRLVAAWTADATRFAPPEGETLLQMVERTSGATKEIEARAGNGTVIIVTHGGPIRGLLCCSMGVALERHWQFQIDAAGITILESHPAGGILARLNDVSHLSRATER